MGCARIYQQVFIAFVFLYAGISCAARATAHRTGMIEVFPVFAWSLFSKVPNTRSEYAIRIVRMNGEPLEPKVFLGAYGKPFRQFGSTDYRKLQAWGAAVAANDELTATKKRAEFESTYLQPFARQLTYELTFRRYDVLERWEDDAFEQITVVATFQLGDEA